MHKKALTYLKNWISSSTRKPIILRGARQVGKTYLARELGDLHFEETVEINFEANPEAFSLFDKSNIPKTLQRIRSLTGKNLIPGQSLLILDEIQAVPELISHLRYFYEKLPELHIVATGSLLEFALKDADFAMPVGRIEYLHLPPISFSEYLSYIQKKSLYEFLYNYSLQEELPKAIHLQLCSHLLDYLVIGGMPEAIYTHVNAEHPEEVEKIKETILQTYESDFSKYRTKVDPQRIRKVFINSIGSIGNKYTYARIDPNDTAANLKRSLELLFLAQVYTPIYHTSAQRPPLASGINPSVLKVLFLDVGLMASRLKVSIADIHAYYNKQQKLHTGYLGAQAEQFIGQHLLSKRKPYQKPEVFYWMREKKGSSAEVDYIGLLKDIVYPIEVKATAPGKLRSLQIFMNEKKVPFGVRYSLQPPDLIKGKKTLISLPHYLVEQQDRLIKEVLSA